MTTLTEAQRMPRKFCDSPDFEGVPDLTPPKESETDRVARAVDLAVSEYNSFSELNSIGDKSKRLLKMLILGNLHTL